MPSKTNKEIEMQKGSTIIELLKKMQLKPDTLIVLRDNKPIPIDDMLENDQELQIIQVASGG
jgi:sulfur carrier protein ThiS